jgi:hypothetical protein
MSRIKCRRDYMTSPAPGFGVEPRKVHVLCRADLPGYYVVRTPGRFVWGPKGKRSVDSLMHESHIGEEASS